jgi:hypothetical protein
MGQPNQEIRDFGIPANKVSSFTFLKIDFF